MRALLSWGPAAITGAILFALPFFAFAEEVSELRITMDVRPDASIFVSESVSYDFGEAERHGIYRDMLLSYKDTLGATEEISVSDISVADEFGKPYAFSAARSGGYERIKIGDPDVLVSGTKTYVILYTVHGAVGYFDDHDEIYWNATGNNWEVPIRSVRVAVWTPALAQSYACYQGVVGSTDECASAVSRLDGAGKPMTLFTSEGTLAPGEGLTIGVGLEKGIIAEPTQAQKSWQLLRSLAPLALPFVTLGVLMWLWWKYGRDARGRGTIIPEYDAPAGLSVVAAAEIVNQAVKPADISALIIALAVRGYLRIERIESKTLGVFTLVDYRFHKLEYVGAGTRVEDTQLMESLFGKEVSVLSSELKSNGRLRKALTKIKGSVEAEMVADGYYRARPSYVRGIFLAASVVIVAAFFLFFGAAATPLQAAGFVISGVLVLAFAFIMPAKTRKGALAKESILGLKDYLQIAEKNRLDFHNAPEKSPELFEKLLPYAMMLGVSAAWAKEFEGIYTESPRWYTGGAYPVFSPTVFADDMKSFSTAAAALAAPTSGSGGSGGGGSSGGGFGGGGGGSW